MALERSLEGRDQLLKLVKRQAREIQELQRTGLQLGEPYTCHGSCLLSLYGDVRGVSYQKESGINSRGVVITNQPTLAPALQGNGWPKRGMVSGPPYSETTDSIRQRPGVEHDPMVTNQPRPGTE